MVDGYTNVPILWREETSGLIVFEQASGLIVE
jgi:hypothetical protein